jgi:Histidine kinase
MRINNFGKSIEKNIGKMFFLRAKTLCLLLFINLVAFNSSAQTPAHFIIGEEELAGIDIYDLFQDKNENYWIASNQGIYKFDGYNFLKTECDGMLGSSIFNLVSDSKNTIYCSNLYGQIFRIKNDSCQLYYKIPDSLMHHEIDLAVDNLDVLTIVTDRIFQINQQKKILMLTDDQANYSCKLFKVNSGKLIAYNTTRRELIEIFNAQVSTRTTDNPPLWNPDFIEVNEEIFAFDKKTGILNQKPGHIKSGQNTLEIGKEGVIGYFYLNDKVWMTLLSGGAYVYDNKFRSQYNGEKTFNSTILSANLRDAEGNILFGTFGEGIIVIPNDEMLNLELQDRDSKATRITKNGKGGVFFGTNTGKIFEIDEQNEITLFDKESYKNIEVLEFISANNLLLTEGDKEPRFISINTGNQKEAELGAIKDVEPSYSEEYLISTNTALYHYRPKMDISLEWINNFTERIYCAALDTINNIIYAGSSLGLKIGDSSEANYFQFEENPIICQDIKYIDGKIYVATQQRGIIIFKDGKPLETWSTKTGLFSNNILKITGDEDLVYISTNKGINVTNKKGDVQYSLNKSDGLLSNSIIDFVLTKEDLWLVGNQGIQKMKKSQLDYFQFTPKISLSSLSINEVKISNLGDNLRVNHDQNKFLFKLSSKSLKYQNEITYQHKLSGVDENWVTNKYEDNTIEYKSLAPGEYNFMAKAVCRGNESKILTYNFRISNPFWLTTWFVLLAILSAIGISGLSVRYLYRRQQIKTQLQSELISSKLTAIQSQMNPHFIFNSLNSIQDLVLQQDGENAYTYISKFAYLVRKILRHSDQDFIDFEDELKVLTVYLELEELRFKKDFNFTINKPEDLDILIPPMLIQPFVENALKHGLLHKKGDKKLRIEFILENENLSCTITDNGVGRERAAEISARKSKDHESFSVESIKSRFDILNELYKMDLGVRYLDLKENDQAIGTQVILSIPYKNKY